MCDCLCQQRFVPCSEEVSPHGRGMLRPNLGDNALLPIYVSQPPYIEN
jgi:hypothetical protein